MSCGGIARPEPLANYPALSPKSSESSRVDVSELVGVATNSWDDKRRPNLKVIVMAKFTTVRTKPIEVNTKPLSVKKERGSKTQRACLEKPNTIASSTCNTVCLSFELEGVLDTHKALLSLKLGGATCIDNR